ncbi:hypothetical protein BJY00DRAFT_270925 [Aspergillus carlsbadensis]|nr:hypothetical protein BJY00DRAFT_270925 [Aspergillus carlsbadensis]
MRHLAVYSLGALSCADIVYSEAISQICNAISGNFACSAKITLPTSAEAMYCPNKFFETDPCKTKTTYRYPCPTWRKPGRMCDGWTCVPGTRETWVDVPCGIDIKTRDVGLCDAVQSELQVNPDLLTKAAAMCDCIPRALALSTDGSLQATDAISDASSATSGLLAVYAELQKCVLDKGFDIQDNRNSLMNGGDLSATDGAIFFKAAEIDLATYIKFAGAVGTCVAGCDVNAIKSFFLDYFEQSREEISSQLRGILDPWTASFGEIQAMLQTLEASVETITASAREVQSRISTLGAPACTDAAGCAESTLNQFNDQVTQTIQLQLSLLQDTITVSDAVSTISSLSTTVRNAVEAASTPLTEQEIIRIVTEGRIKKLADIIQVFKFPEDFRKLISDLRYTIPTVSQFSVILTTRAQAIIGNITDVVSDSWLQQADVSSDAARALRQNIATIQDAFRGQVLPAITDLQTKINAITGILSSLPFSGKPPTIDAKVASYQRWSRIVTNMPCSRWATKEYSVQGYRGSFGYPQFYSCSLEATVPWPNHHIPFVKITFQ